jgi:putative hydrolase of the HAD superfamily
LFLQLEEIFWQNFLSEIELFAGVEEFLKLIKNQNIPLALVTDLTSNIQYRKLVKLGMVSCFDFILTSEEAGGDKPSGLPFVILDRAFMHIPKNSWFIGDSEHDSPKFLENHIFFFKKVKKRDKFRLGNVIEFESFNELCNLV